MIVQGQYKEADYVAAQWLHIRPRRIFAVLGVLILCGALWALWVARSWVLLASLGYLVLWALYIPFKAKRSFLQHKALSEPVEMQVRNEGLFFKRENGEGLVPWNHIVKWRWNDRLALLYPTSSLFHMVPRHFFATDEMYQSFRNQVQEKVGNAT